MRRLLPPLLVALFLVPVLVGAGAPVASVITAEVQAQSNAHKQQCFVGDSTTAGVGTTGSPWPQMLQMERQFLRYGAFPAGVGGLRCDQIETQVFNLYVVTPAGKTRGCTHVFICCGVNDFMQSFTSAQVYGTGDTNDTDRGPWLRMVRKAQLAGMGVTACTVAPWKGHAQWSAGKQTQQDAFNALVRTTSGIYVADFYAYMGDPADAQALRSATAPTYEGTPPDKLHWGGAGNKRAQQAANESDGGVPGPADGGVL